MRRLLTHLAQFSSFARQGELLCTQSLAHFLQDGEARAAFSAFIADRMTVEVPSELAWRAEVRQQDLGRPDLEGCTVDGLGLVKIEAKLGAELGAGQLGSYVDDLHARCEQGLLLVLVPRRRADEAAKIVSETFALPGRGPWQLPGASLCRIAVIHWEEVVEVLRTVRSEAFRADLEQFEAMFKGLNGDVIEAFTSAEELLDPEREEALLKLVDRVTRLLVAEGKVMPMGVDQDRNRVKVPVAVRLPPFPDKIYLLQRGCAAPVLRVSDAPMAALQPKHRHVLPDPSPSDGLGTNIRPHSRERGPPLDRVRRPDPSRRGRPDEHASRSDPRGHAGRVRVVASR